MLTKLVDKLRDSSMNLPQVLLIQLLVPETSFKISQKKLKIILAKKLERLEDMQTQEVEGT